MIRLGILGCSEIAFNRFLPAAMNVRDLHIVAIAEEYDKTKLDRFTSRYKLEINDSFKEIIERDDIDAVYIPQPPAYHFVWAKEALLHCKHVLLEKPATISMRQSQELVNIASERGLALHENYMFQYHSQVSAINRMISSGLIGEPRLYRISFGFPLREANDFRYVKELGGGALIDAGGYAVKLATLLLGDSIRLDTSTNNFLAGYEVDMYGSATFSNRDGMVCQVGYGMDCHYQCSLEVWGSKAKLYTNRIFTAPAGYVPTVFIEDANGVIRKDLEEDNHFQRSIERFLSEIKDVELQKVERNAILRQAKLIEQMGKKYEHNV